MKTAVAYVRVSRETEVSSIHSTETQRTMIENYANQNGIEIIDWFSDVNVSGGKKTRQNLSQAVSLAKRTGSYLIVKDLSRLSRRASECLSLLSEVNVIDTTLGIDADEKVLALMGLFAEWERQACSTRQRETIAYLRKQDPNRQFGNPQTLVQGRVTSQQRRTAMADEFAMKLAPLIMTDETLQQVADKLMQFGIKTRRGKANWSAKTVRGMRLRVERLSGMC